MAIPSHSYYVLILMTFSVVLLCQAAHRVQISNNCRSEIWVGMQGNYGKSQPEHGGFKLQYHQKHTVIFPDAWGGRVWARTGCGSGPCETGDCGGGTLHCNGSGGIPPVTLMEITFDGYAGLDYYDISLVDGFNIEAKVVPVKGTYDTTESGNYYCKTASCGQNINSLCPAQEMKVYGHSGNVVACKSACLAFNTDRFCCRGEYGTPDKCPPFPYSNTFKQACPKAYSYAHDDEKSTFTCKGRPGMKTAYEILFC